MRLPRGTFGAGWRASVSTPYFSLKAKDNEEKKKRIGVVVGVAVEKSAARRNFWKRQAKAALARRSVPEKDILLILTPKIKTLTRKKFQEAVAAALARLR